MRERRGDALRAAATGASLPVRYIAAFESERPHLVFRSRARAEAFLSEYARYLGLDPIRVVRAFRARHPLPEARPESGAPALVEGASQAVPHSGGTARPRRRARASTIAARRKAATLVALLTLVSLAVLAVQIRSDAGSGDGAGDGSGPRRAVGGPPGTGGASPATGSESPSPSATPTDVAPVPETLPGGGTQIFPYYRVVAHYGSPVSERLGLLGVGSPDAAAAEVLARTEEYTGEGLRPVLPAMHLIATLASDAPGNEGLYNFRLSEEDLLAYAEASRDAGALLVLDIQPGRADFLSEVQRYEELLLQPHVGIALDPEWHVDEDEAPGDVVGTVDAAEIREVAEYLARIIREHALPQKLFIVHQFRDSMITNRDAILTPPELALVIDIDGVGPRSIKLPKYDELTAGIDRYYVGIKLYTNSETDILQPDEVLDLLPRPDVVIYQ